MIETYLIVALSSLAAVRMLIWLFAPARHKGIAIGLYDKKKVTAKRIVYFGLFVGLSVALILRGSIVNFMLAFFAIGSLYDFLFTFFDYSGISQVEYEQAVQSGWIPVRTPVLQKVRWYIGGPMILLTIWLWVYVLTH